MAHSFPVRAVKRYLDAQGPNWATIIGWNGLFALFPLILVTITVLGAVLHIPGVADNIRTQVSTAFPDEFDRNQVLKALAGARDQSILLAVISFLGLMWSGSGLFSAIEQGLTALYSGKPRDFLRQKLMAFAMILLFAVLVLPLVLSSSLLPALRSLSVVPSWLTSGPAGLLIQLGAGVIDAALIFVAIYYVVPNRKQRLRHVLPGAFAAGLLLEGLTLLFPLYFRLAGGFARYGAAFALFFLLMTWAFFFGQITMLGGAVNAELEAPRKVDGLSSVALSSDLPPEVPALALPPGSARRGHRGVLGSPERPGAAQRR